MIGPLNFRIFYAFLVDDDNGNLGGQNVTIGCIVRRVGGAELVACWPAAPPTDWGPSVTGGTKQKPQERAQ